MRYEINICKRETAVAILKIIALREPVKGKTILILNADKPVLKQIARPSFL